jgi:hypothetical protein
MLNLNVDDADGRPVDTYEAMFLGLNTGQYPRKVLYPCMMYLQDTKPLMVENTEQEAAAREKGYDSVTPGALSNRFLVNWFWDFEDMSPRQLVVFAKDEYGVELPIECGQLKLFELVCDLTRSAPQNRNRLILMAHTMKLNYDETLEEIKRSIDRPDKTANVEVEEWEIFA